MWFLSANVLATNRPLLRARRLSVARYVTAIDATITYGIAGLVEAANLALRHVELADAMQARDSAWALNRALRVIAARMFGVSLVPELNGKPLGVWMSRVLQWVRSKKTWDEEDLGPPPDRPDTRCPDMAFNAQVARMTYQNFAKKRVHNMARRIVDAYRSGAISRP